MGENMCGITLVPDVPEYAEINSKSRGPDVLATHPVMIGGIWYQLRFYRLCCWLNTPTYTRWERTVMPVTFCCNPIDLQP